MTPGGIVSAAAAKQCLHSPLYQHRRESVYNCTKTSEIVIKKILILGFDAVSFS